MMQLDPSSSSISACTPINPIPSEHPLQVEVITYMDSDLFKAAEDGDKEPFSKYKGSLHCLVDKRQNTALHIYSRTGGRQVIKKDKWFLCFKKKRFEKEFSINFVEQLVDKCPSLLLQPNVKGEIPLHIAARHGHCDVVKFLIERAKGVQQEDVEKGLEATRMKQMLRMTDKDGNTVMHKAVESGSLDVVRLLVKELDPDLSFSTNKSDETPVYVAAKAKRDLLVAEILDNCKSTDYGGPDGRTALHAAVLARDDKSVKKLMEANKHLTKETDDNGWTPLHYAAGWGWSGRRIRKLLLESDASAACITDKEKGMTPLHMAAWRGRRDIMEDIISFCPSCCEIVDKRGWNFLHFAVVTLDPVELRKFLLGDKNKIKDLPIKNLLDEKDVNGNRPFDVLISGPLNRDKFRYGLVSSFFERHGTETRFYTYLTSETKKKQIRKLLKDIANDEVAVPSADIFRKTVEEIDKALDKEEDISQDKIEENAQQSHLLVATLVATVTFTAAFTVPGGYKSGDQGTATLIRDSAFKTFVITNTLAFAASLSAISFHFFVVMYRLEVIKKYINPNLIHRADQLTFLAMAAMGVAFSTGTYAVLQSSSGFAIAALSFGLVFFPISVALFTFDFFRSAFKKDIIS